MPAKKGRYTAKTACARAGKAALHRVQTPVFSAPPSSEEYGPDDSDFPDLHHSSAVSLTADLDLPDHHQISPAGLTDDSDFPNLDHDSSVPLILDSDLLDAWR